MSNPNKYVVNVNNIIQTLILDLKLYLKIKKIFMQPLLIKLL